MVTTSRKNQTIVGAAIPAEVRAGLEQLAKEEERTISFIIRRAIVAELARRGKEA